MSKVVLALVTLFVLSGCATSRSIQLTCAIAHEPAKYVGREVRLSGVVVTDFIHAAALGETGCPGELVPIGSLAGVISGRREFYDTVFGGGAFPPSVVQVVVEGAIVEEPDRIPRYVFAPHRFLRIVVTTGAVRREIRIDTNDHR